MKKGILSLVVLFLVWYAFTVFDRIYWNDGEGEVAVTVESGSTLATVTGQLVALEALDAGDAWLFELYAKVSGKDRGIKAGDFVVTKGASASSILQTLAYAASAEKTLTFLEGWDLRDIAGYLVAQGVAQTEEEVYEVTGYPGQVRAPKVGVDPIPEFASKPNKVSLEGYLYPETYRVFENATLDDVVKTLLTQFTKEVSTILPSGATQQDYYNGHSFYEVLTVASILENEVRTTKDRRMVADLVWRRMEADWPLQMDSTVNYITGKSDPSVRLDDLVVESPYNTYQQTGLPYGPINNPSLDAIEAAINPTPNEFWFFLTSPDGTVHYGRTLDEHAANRKFL